MKRIARCLPLTFVYVLFWALNLTACRTEAVVSPPSPRRMPPIWTETAVTPSTSSQASATPTAAGATNTPSPVGTIAFPAATQPGEQVYRDPAGLYAFNFPADWEPDRENPNIWRGEDGFVETAYLPEMAFISSPLDICHYWANITEPLTYSISWMGAYHGCELTSLPGIDPPVGVWIVESAGHDWAKRYLYVKADPEHLGRIISSFLWMMPRPEKPIWYYADAELRPQDVEFWERAVPVSDGVNIQEFKLPPEAQNADPRQTIFLEFIPPEALPTQSVRTPRPTQDPKLFDGVYEHFGYEFRPTEIDGFSDLYQYGELLLENVYSLYMGKPEPFFLQTEAGEIISQILLVVKDPEISYYQIGNSNRYLLHNDNLVLWAEGPPSPMQSGYRPVYDGQEVIRLDVGDHIQLWVRDSLGQTLSTFVTTFGSRLPINGFRGGDGYWALEVTDFTVLNGEILNEILGLEEVYDWHIRADKPFFFFRKGPRTGISYDGEYPSNYYHEILHGMCCGLALNNPRVFDDSIRFFGRRDGVWYYVVLTFE